MVIDAAAHPVAPTGDEIRQYMSEPWRSKSFPGPERYQYASPFGEYRAGTEPASGLPGSDPQLFERQLLEENGIAHAVLLPLTRGLLPNTDLGSAVCAATNDWLADVWLRSSSRFLGTIRINPADPDAAVAEIERWADHPGMVQVAVPLQSPHPYGQRGYFRIWEAAAARSLPVALHVDGGASIDFHASAAGGLRYALEYATLYPLNVAYHLASFVAEGVFERLAGLRIVCADGGLSAVTPIVWRLDKDWRSTREEIPWTKRLPSAYLREHVRFCLHASDIPRAPGLPEEWWDAADGGSLLMYSSNYPQRDCLFPGDAVAGLADETARRVLFENAADLYSLDLH
jgi:predicted TIM-barrel fold metal-dependent hydrolase